MVETQEGGTCTYKSRLASAQEAAKNFVNQFVNETGAEGTDKRMVAIVSFGSDAKRELDWVDVHNDNATQTNMTAVNSAIDGLTANGGTNIEAGLMLAKNNLLDGRKPGNALDGISEIYTILLTDGKPTYYVNGSNISLTGPIIGSTGSGTNSGSTTDKEDVEDVGNEAKAILGLTDCNSRLYSICFGTVTVENKETPVYETTLSGQYWPNANPPVKSDDTVGKWLEKFSTKACNGESTANGLFDSFGTIIKLMNIGAKAWLVEDSMGNYISNEGSIPVKNRDNNGSIHNAVDVDTNGTIKWYLLDSHMDDNITTLTTDDDGAVTGVAGFTYKYKIKLDNLATDHTAGTAYNTNDSATLKYMVPDKDGNWPTEEDETTGELKDLKTGTFANPSVESLAGDLEFTKVNENGDALAGAGFTLALKNETGWTSMTATSDQSGKVSFNDIPSGHSYTLSETTVPEGYQKMTDVDVTVSYGAVSETGFTKTDAGVLTLKNNPKLGTITVTKSFSGLPENVRPEKITVSIYNTNGTEDTNDDTSAGTLTLNASNNWSASATLPYGTYTLAEQTDSISVLDNGNYSLSKVEFAPSSEVTISSTTASASVTLTNTYTQNTGTITVEKKFAGLPENLRPEKITVDIFKKGEATATTSVTLESSNGWKASATLPYGTYVFEESGAEVDDYTNIPDIYPASVDLNENNRVATVTLTNTYSLKSANLIIKKVIKGIDEKDIKNVEFQMYDSTTHSKKYNAQKANKDNGWTVRWSGEISGTYTVEETVEYSNQSYVEKYYTLATTWDTDQPFTLKPGETKTITCTNTYSLHEAASIELPISKTVACGEGGVVAPAGERTFKFKMTIADDTPAIARVKVNPGEYAVSFMDKKLTPVNGVYFFDMTVDGIGKQTGTLKINGHADDLNNRKITISELTQTESGYPLDSRWTYDTTVFSVYVSLNDDGEFSLEYSADPQSETWKGESVEFVNLYTDVPVEEGGEPPKTGDNSHFVLWTMLAVLSAAGFVFLMKRRNAHS